MTDNRCVAYRYGLTTGYKLLKTIELSSGSLYRVWKYRRGRLKKIRCNNRVDKHRYEVRHGRCDRCPEIGLSSLECLGLHQWRHTGNTFGKYQSKDIFRTQQAPRRVAA